MSRLFNFAVHNLEPGELVEEFEIAAANLSPEELNELYLAIVLDYQRQSSPNYQWTDLREDFDLYQSRHGGISWSGTANERLKTFQFYMLESFPELSLDIREHGRVAKEWFAERRAQAYAQQTAARSASKRSAA